MPKHEVRGPDPDGDWFVVQIDGDEETAIDETFGTEAKAQAAADKLKQKEQGSHGDRSSCDR